MAFSTGNEKFNAKTYAIGNNHNRQYLDGTVNEFIEETLSYSGKLTQTQEILTRTRPGGARAMTA
jgi:hypothetical protein